VKILQKVLGGGLLFLTHTVIDVLDRVGVAHKCDGQTDRRPFAVARSLDVR